MATIARINRRRDNKRMGHSVKCWTSKWSHCKCSHKPGADKNKF